MTWFSVIFFQYPSQPHNFVVIAWSFPLTIRIFVVSARTHWPHVFIIPGLFRILSYQHFELIRTASPSTIPSLFHCAPNMPCHYSSLLNLSQWWIIYNHYLAPTLNSLTHTFLHDTSWENPKKNYIQLSAITHLQLEVDKKSHNCTDWSLLIYI